MTDQTLTPDQIALPGSPYAAIIADSISPQGVRLTTVEARWHRFVHSEFMTHRIKSRNAASSRAIPFEKMLERVMEDPAFPLVWPAEQKGMQGGAPLSEKAIAEAREIWTQALHDVAKHATRLRGLGSESSERLHKSLVNRLLEPWSWITVVITATAWDNFFDQRVSPLAQPELNAVAGLIKIALERSTPKRLREGEWHLPYVRSEDYNDASNLHGLGESMYPTLVKISAARCARVSYLTQAGIRDLDEDLRLYTDLTTAKPKPHWSPLEHVATPWPENWQYGQIDFIPIGAGTRPDGQKEWASVRFDHLPKVGNLLGWRSLRTEVEALQNEVTYR